MTMSAAEFAAYRHILGHTLDSLATALEVNPRTVRSWESGRDPIPDSRAAATLELVSEHTRLAMRMADAEGVVVLPRHPDRPLPRGYYVAAAARALQVEPDLMIEWDDADRLRFSLDSENGD